MRVTRIRNRVRGLWWKVLTSWYRRELQKCGSGFLVKGPCRIRNGGRIEVGNDCIIDSSWALPVRLDVGKAALLTVGSNAYFNEGVHIVCNIGVSIGNRCLIASDVVFIDDDGHPIDCERRHDHWPDGPESRLGAPIVIEDNAWIGTRAIILKGVTIGRGSVVAAGAVVTRSVPELTVVAGVPARVIRGLHKTPLSLVSQSR
jgi:acetyltransferase-like isoleucine patch superfamily enzyme